MYLILPVFVLYFLALHLLAFAFLMTTGLPVTLFDPAWFHFQFVIVFLSPKICLYFIIASKKKVNHTQYS